MSFGTFIHLSAIEQSKYMNYSNTQDGWISQIELSGQRRIYKRHIECDSIYTKPKTGNLVMLFRNVDRGGKIIKKRINKIISAIKMVITYGGAEGRDDQEWTSGVPTMISFLTWVIAYRCCFIIIVQTMFYDSLHFFPVVSELTAYLIYFFTSYLLLFLTL